MPHGPNPALFMNRRRDAQHRAAVDDANADDTSEVAPQAHASAMDATIAAAHVLSTMRSRRRLGADDAGAVGMDNLAPPVEFAVRREELLRAIARFQARDKYCWTLPVGLLGFTLWCIALIVHANIGAANLVESGLSATLGIGLYAPGGGAVVAYDTASFYTWLTGSVLAYALPDGSGTVNRYGRLVGGLRVSQTRSQAVAGCAASPFGALRAAIVGDQTCYPSGSDSTAGGWNTSAAFVEADINVTWCNVTVPPAVVNGSVTHAVFALSTDGVTPPVHCDDPPYAGDAFATFLVPAPDPTQETDVRAAFTANGYSWSAPPVSRPRAVDDAGLSAPFTWLFDYYGGPPVTAATSALLHTAGWVDLATTRVTTSFAVLDVELGYWARAQFAVDFSRGGAVTTTANVKSLPIDAYESVTALLLLDAFVLVYAAVHWGMLARNCVRRVRRVRVLCARATAMEAFAHATEVWFLIDLATAMSLLATIALWVLTVAEGRRLRSSAESASWAAGPPVATATLTTLAWLESALSLYGSFRAASVAATFLLMLRVFWQFSLQPRLAILSEAVSRSLSDLCHFGFVFSVVLVFFGVWGHAYFGGQGPRWATPLAAAYAVISMTDYEYDLIDMAAVDVDAARFFFVVFMFTVTNLLLWMFLAIVMDMYATVRIEVEKSPSALADFVAGARDAPARVARVSRQLRAGLGGGAGSGGSSKRRPPSSSAGGGGGGGACRCCYRLYVRCCRRRARGLHGGADGDNDEDDGWSDASGLSGSRGGIDRRPSRRSKLRARRVVDILQSEAYVGRDTVTAGDIATLAGAPLPDTFRFLRRFLPHAVPDGMDLVAEMAAANGARPGTAAGRAAGSLSGRRVGGIGGGGGGASRFNARYVLGDPVSRDDAAAAAAAAAAATASRGAGGGDDDSNGGDTGRSARVAARLHDSDGDDDGDGHRGLNGNDRDVPNGTPRAVAPPPPRAAPRGVALGGRRRAPLPPKGSVPRMVRNPLVQAAATAAAASGEHADAFVPTLVAPPPAPPPPDAPPAPPPPPSANAAAHVDALYGSAPRAHPAVPSIDFAAYAGAGHDGGGDRFTYRDGAAEAAAAAAPLLAADAAAAAPYGGSSWSAAPHVADAANWHGHAAAGTSPAYTAAAAGAGLDGDGRGSAAAEPYQGWAAAAAHDAAAGAGAPMWPPAQPSPVPPAGSVDAYAAAARGDAGVPPGASSPRTDGGSGDGADGAYRAGFAPAAVRRSGGGAGAFGGQTRTARERLTLRRLQGAAGAGAVRPATTSDVDGAAFPPAAEAEAAAGLPPIPSPALGGESGDDDSWAASASGLLDHGRLPAEG